MYSRIAGALCAAAVLIPLFLTSSLGHEGHDHGEQQAAGVTDVTPRGEASSDLYELVAIAKGEELIVYVDRVATNEPVNGATVEAETPLGPLKAKADPDGSYRLPVSFLRKPGRYELIFTVVEQGNADVLPVALVVAEAAPPDVPAHETTLIRRLAKFLEGSEQRAIFFGAGGLIAGVLLGTILMRSQRAATLPLLLLLMLLTTALSAHEGHDHAEEKPATAAQPSGERAQRLSNGSIFVPKPVQRIFALRTQLSEKGQHPRAVELPGRIIPDPNASGYVQATVGGRLSPAQQGFLPLGAKVKQGDVLAYVTPPLQAIDVSDMRQKQGELDQQIAIVERRLTRQEQLAASATVSRAQVEETRLELQGLRDRRASLDKVRREPEALVAPVSGIIAEGSPVAGQIVASSAIVFHIVDPARLWVEALSFQPLAATKTASASTPGGQNVPLSYRGSGLAGRSQSIPVHFAINGDTSGLRAGQFVTVAVTTDEEATGIALPRSSLVRSANGQEFVFEHIAAERFVARAVRTEPLNAELVLVAAGLSPGKRIVTQGAELLDHVR